MITSYLTLRFDSVKMELYTWRLIAVVACLTNRTGAEDICWSTFGNFQYKVLTGVGGVSFSNAIKACENENTTLASVLTSEEDQFLQTFAMSQIGVPVWIGLYRKDQNISWIDGSDVTYISKNYRRKSYEESCVYMFQGWIEAHCQDAELYFICKREVIEANTCLVTSSTIASTSEGPTESNEETADISTTQTNPGDQQTDDSKSLDTVTEVADETLDKNSELETPATETETDDVYTTATSGGIKTEYATVNTDQTQDNYPNTRTTSVISINPDTSTDKLPYTAPAGTNTEPSTPTTKSTTEPRKDDVSNPYEVVSRSWESTFAELLNEMTVKEKPVYSTTEAKNSTAIGSVSILILLGVVFGVVLLDISTIRNHLKLFKSNTKGFCSKCRKGKKARQTDIVIELVDMDDN